MFAYTGLFQCSMKNMGYLYLYVSDKSEIR